MTEGNAKATNLWQFVQQFWPLLLGNVLEWYDFGIYSFLAPEMKTIFFHSSAISTWAGYTVTFLLRPLGGFLNGWLADKYGRRVAVMASIIGMLVATLGQGMLPTYLCCGDGWGTMGLVTLLVLRALQGLSAGGELGPIVAYIGESAPANRMRAASGLLIATAALGFLVANLLVTLVVELVGPEGMTSWGWRIPFLASAVPGTIALWGRNKLEESSEFVGFVAEQSHAEDNLSNDSSDKGKPAQTRLRDHALAVLAGFLATCALAVCWYSGLWCPSYLKSRGMNHTLALLACCAFTGIVMISWVVWPLLADLFCPVEPVKVMLLGGLALTVASFPVFLVISTASSEYLEVVSIITLAAFGLVIGFAGSHTYIFVIDLFPVQLRALGFGMSCNLAFALVGGTAPLIDAAILQAWEPGVGLYWSLASLTTLVGMGSSLYWRQRGWLPSYLISKKAPTKNGYDSKSLADIADDVATGGMQV